MNTPHHQVPDDAPGYAKSWLKHCRSRKQLWTLVVLCILAALATSFAERGKPAALLGLVFLFASIGPLLAVRWGERNHFFDKG